ncbi:MAG: FKBP-type peptidyl-prolyl cis-trans isomerase, partial [Lysobacteraceae bacterium]
MKWAIRGAAASMLVAMTMLAGSVTAQDKTTLASEREKFSYAVGMDFGSRIKPVVPFMDMAAFEAALKQAFAGGQAPLTESEARAVDET